MKRSDLSELQYITPITNVPSIVTNGILSHRLADRFKPTSVASEEVQSRRAAKTVPGGGRLHDYVNLYLCARNPMMYYLQDRHMDLCVLRVSVDVLDMDGVIIADGNAAADFTSFRSFPNGLDKLSHDLVFAEYWTDANPTMQKHKKRVKCAEALVPDRVDPRYFIGAWVSCAQSQQKFEQICNVPVSVDGHLFFQ